MIKTSIVRWGFIAPACWLSLAPLAVAGWEGKVAGAPEGWTVAAPRDEIRPGFAFEPHGGLNGQGAFVIKADRREGLDGAWVRTFPVQGGRCYRFHAVRKIEKNGTAVCGARTCGDRHATQGTRHLAHVLP